MEFWGAGSRKDAVHTLNVLAAVEALNAAGGDVAALYRDVGFTEEHLRSNSWISWREFVHFSECVERQFEALKADFGKFFVRNIPAVSAALGAIASAKQVFRTFVKLGSYAVPALQSTMEVREDELRIRIFRPQEDFDGAAFFRLSTQVFRQAPALVGFLRRVFVPRFLL